MGISIASRYTYGAEKQHQNRPVKINGAFAKWISAEDRLNLKQRIYSVQDKLIALALW